MAAAPQSTSLNTDPVTTSSKSCNATVSNCKFLAIDSTHRCCPDQTFHCNGTRCPKNHVLPMVMAVPLGVATMGWSVVGTIGYRIVGDQIAKRRSEKEQGKGQEGVVGKGERGDSIVKEKN